MRRSSMRKVSRKRNSKGGSDCAPTRPAFDRRRKPTAMTFAPSRRDINHNAHQEIGEAKTMRGANLRLDTVTRPAN